MFIKNAKIIASALSKKGSVLVSLYSDPNHLVSNAVISNPTKHPFNVGDVCDGTLIINNGGINTFVIDEIRKEN